jgi:aspartate/methionine/tyrosine aminotransferase
MLEVCSTSLPQYSIPLVMGDPRYVEHLERRKRIFEKRANEAWETLSKVKGIKVVEPKGAFYLSVIFDTDSLNHRQTLPIKQNEVRQHVETIVQGVDVDKRFVYYLLASTGICVVPMTGFYSNLKGFRMTLLETDDRVRQNTLATIAQAIETYIASAH